MSHATHSSVPANPSEVACIDFVNSAFTDHLGGGADGDRIASAEWQHWFLDRYDLTPDTRGSPPITKLLALRRDLRRILEKWAAQRPLTSRDVRLLDARVGAATVRIRVARGADQLDLGYEPVRRDWDWILASVAASAVALMATGDPRRLKSCGNPNCSWMFLDTTVNRSRQYCCANPCGSLIRVRRFRHQA